MNPYHHALSSARKHGGEPHDYLPLHAWFDESKAFFPDIRHRALRHHAEGIFLAERIFGPTLTNREGRVIPTPLSRGTTRKGGLGTDSHRARLAGVLEGSVLDAETGKPAGFELIPLISSPLLSMNPFPRWKETPCPQS